MQPSDEGKRLKLFIERENMSQEEFGAAIGVRQVQLSKYCTGTHAVPLKVAKKIHLRFGLNYSWFFHGTGPQKVKGPEKRNIMTDLTDIYASIAVMMASQEKMREDINRMARAQYSTNGK